MTFDSPAPIGLGRAGKFTCPLSCTALRRAVLDERLNPTRLAERYDVSRDTAARWIADAGLHRPDAILTHDVLRPLYVEAGMTVRNIAAHLNVSNNRVLRALANAGIDPRPRSQPRPGIHYVSDEDMRLAYVEQRLSLTDMVTKFGVTRYYLQRRIRELGLTKRPGSHTPRSRWSAEELTATIVRLDHADVAVADIAQRLEVSTSTVQHVLHRSMLPIRRSKKIALSDRAPSRVEQLYGDPAIVQCLSDHDVEIPELHEWSPASAWSTYAPQPLSADLVRDLYLCAGLPIQAIAWLCGVSTATVRNTMIRAAIPPRRAGTRAPWRPPENPKASFAQ
jgi:transposase